MIALFSRLCYTAAACGDGVEHWVVYGCVWRVVIKGMWAQAGMSEPPSWTYWPWDWRVR